MAFNKAKENRRAAAQEPGTVVSFSIENAKDTDYGTRFTLVLNGVSINGCGVGETREGKYFIKLPSYKGKDGKYYNHVFFRFTDEDTVKILDALAAALG